MSDIVIPDVPLRAWHYYPDKTIEEIDPVVTDVDMHNMQTALDWSDVALRNGNPPIGSVLHDRELGKSWGNTTRDKTVRHLLAHAEVRTYLEDAQPFVGDDLSHSTLYSPAELCATCSAVYAEGKVHKIIYSASRSLIFNLTGLMRPRDINMPDMLRDGNTDTVVVEGVLAKEALEKFLFWKDLRDRGAVNG